MGKAGLTVDSPMYMIAKGIALIVLGVAAAYMVKSFIDYMESRMEGFAARAATVTYYFMEGCPHCRSMKPEWAKFKAMASKGDTVVAKEVSADLDGDAVSKADPKVSGFPTIHISWQDKVTEYKGPRDADSIMAAVKKAML